MTRIALLLSVPVSLAVASPALGQTVLDMLYVRTDLGASLVPDIRLKDLPTLPGGFGITNLDVSVDPGMAWTIEAGLKLTDYLAVEVQTGYFRNSVDSISGGQFVAPPFDPIPIIGGSGRFEQVPILANVLFEIPLIEEESGFGSMRLELGGGIGAVQVSGRMTAEAGPDPTAALDGLTISFDGSDWVFGYQGTVALRWDLSPHVDIGIRYRFMGTTDVNFGAIAYNVDPTGFLPTGDMETDHVFTNAIQASLGIRF